MSEEIQRSYKVQKMNLKLKAMTKAKICIERQVFTLNNTERSLNQEFNFTEHEIEFLSEQLKDLKDKISEANYKLSTTVIQLEAEKVGINNYVNNLYKHKNKFNNMFAEERTQLELRTKELMEKEAEEQELEWQKKRELDAQSELQIIEIQAIEEECDVIERACVVLKKRNAAIMLKMRRRLVEAEETRRELMNKRNVSFDDINDDQTEIK